VSDLLLLFDAHALVHRSYHAVRPLTTSTGEQTNAVFGFASVLLKQLNDFRPMYVGVAFDRPTPTFRHVAYTDYKANRTRTADDLRPQFARVREFVAALAIPILEAEGFEADDVLGTISVQASAGDLDVVIVTGDTDALQLVDDRVRVMTPSRGIAEEVMYDHARVRERYGLNPPQIVDFKALKGDPSDNIKGVPGVGEKTATRLLQQFGTVERLIEESDALDPRVGDGIRAHRSDLELGKTLTLIRRDAPVSFDREAFRFGRFDAERARAFLRDLEFRSLIARLPVPSTTVRSVNPQIAMFAEDAPAPTEIAISATPPGRALDRAAALEIIDAARATRHLAVLVETAPGVVGPFAPALGLGFVAPGVHAAYAHVDGGVPADDAPLRLLGAILSDPSIAKTGHDLKRSIHVLRTLGLPLAGLHFDTLIAAFVADNARRSFDLKDLLWAELSIDIADPAVPMEPGRGRLRASPSPEEMMRWVCARTDALPALAAALAAALERVSLADFCRFVELPCIETLAGMEQVGIAIDARYLAEMSQRLGIQLGEAQTAIWTHAGHEFNVNSPVQLGQILFDELQLPRGKKTRTGWSTDAETLEDLRGVHPIVDLLFEFRQVGKLKSTYVDALPQMVDQRTGRLHTTFNQVGANTGRMSSSDPNLQNIPIRTELGRDVRRAFVASSSESVIVAADYSQVELRILAHISRDLALIEAFERGEDIHASTASRILGIALNAVSADQRRLAKVVNYGIAYGLGEHGLATQAGISRHDAGTFIRAYLERHSGIAAYIEDVKRSCTMNGYVETLMGRKVFLPDIVSINRVVRSAAERRAINAPIQGSNADFMKVAMARIDRQMRRREMASKMLLQVHDELVFEAPKVEAEELAALVRDEMISVFALDPALEVEVKVGANWCDVGPL